MSIFDMLLSNAMGEGGGGGGGGSSPFNSAQVTLIPKSGYASFGLYDPGNSEEPWGYHCFYVLNNQIVMGAPTAYEETVFTIYYIGDSLELTVDNAYESSTGDVTYNADTNTVTITGNCTITGYVDG